MRNVGGRDLEKKGVIDVFLEHQETDPGYYTDTVVKGIVLVMLTASTDTSALITEWAMALLLKHPKAMWKARAEIDANVGMSRLVEESDIANLPCQGDPSTLPRRPGHPSTRGNGGLHRGWLPCAAWHDDPRERLGDPPGRQCLGCTRGIQAREVLGQRRGHHAHAAVRAWQEAMPR